VKVGRDGGRVGSGDQKVPADDLQRIPEGRDRGYPLRREKCETRQLPQVRTVASRVSVLLEKSDRDGGRATCWEEKGTALNH